MHHLKALKKKSKLLDVWSCSWWWHSADHWCLSHWSDYATVEINCDKFTYGYLPSFSPAVDDCFSFQDEGWVCSLSCQRHPQQRPEGFAKCRAVCLLQSCSPGFLMCCPSPLPSPAGSGGLAAPVSLARTGVQRVYIACVYIHIYVYLYREGTGTLHTKLVAPPSSHSVVPEAGRWLVLCCCSWWRGRGSFHRGAVSCGALGVWYIHLQALEYSELLFSCWQDCSYFLLVCTLARVC